MKRALHITLQFDDEPWIDEGAGKEYPTDAIAYAMDQVNNIFQFLSGDVEFCNAILDGETLVYGDGRASEEVKKRAQQHRAFLKEIASRSFYSGSNGVHIK